MIESEQELLTAWLRDAYAMEGEKARLMKAVREDFEGGTELKAYVDQRAHEAARHQETVAMCLDMLGEKPAGENTEVLGFTTFLSGVNPAGFPDKRVNDLLLLHSWCHFAHLCYESLTHIAHRLGETDIRAECMELGRRSQDLADYTRDYIMTITDEALEEAAITR